MSNDSLTTKNVMRQCAIQKKMLPRKELFRVVRTKRGNILFDPEYKIFGRGIHFSKTPEISAKFFDPRKRGMVSHFLRMQVTPEKFLEIQEAVDKIIS